MYPTSSPPANTRQKTLNERLLDVSRALSQPIEMEPLLQLIISAVCELTQSEAGSIFLYEEESGLLKFLATPSWQKDTLKTLRVPVENSIAGQCFKQSKPLVVNQAAKDPRHYRTVDQTIDFQTSSLAAAPIIYHKNTIGVLEAVNKLHNAHYTEEDVTILETLACYAAQAIQATQLQEQVQRAYNDMQQLERMKSDFIAITSHELRTPLGLILGHATVLSESLQDKTIQQHAQVIVESASRLKDIVDDLTNVDKVQSGQMSVKHKTFTLNDLVKEVLEGFAEMAQSKRISMFLDLPETPLVIEGDTEKIAIALGNLVKNALTFTDPKGHVWISVESLPGYAKLSVVDDGIGIPPKDLPHVFERFFQVESHMTRRHGGMGLGLSVAKVMIENHGGQIWVESIEGRGSNFSFLLPAGTAQSRAENKVFEM